MFFGREKELETLNRRYKNNQFEFLVIRGRRRVGKSTLLKKFGEDKKDVIFFTAQETTKKENLELFSKQVNTYFKKGGIYANFQDLLTDIFESAKKKKMILIIDEFPYLAKSDKSIMSKLQTLIDNYQDKTKLFLIVCGSSISFMEEKVLSYKAPLYGRSTGQMKIEPFGIKETQKYIQTYSNTDKVMIYAIFGGIPAYLRFINSKKNLQTNIINNFFDKDNVIYDEPKNLLKEELREPAVYNSIITAIATGSSKLNEIATKTGIEKSKIIIYLKKLIELQIIKKEQPITEKENSRKSIYELNDNLFKFWYRFIAQNKTSIEFDDDKERLYNEIIKPYLEDYTGKIFEEICKQYFLRNISSKDKTPFIYNQIGRWWGTNPKLRQEEEIDLLFYTNDNKRACFVECKWKNQKVGMDVLNELIRKAELLNQFDEKNYALCSKSGFKQEVVEYAKENKNVWLYELDDILEE